MRVLGGIAQTSHDGLGKEREGKDRKKKEEYVSIGGKKKGIGAQEWDPENP